MYAARLLISGFIPNRTFLLGTVCLLNLSLDHAIEIGGREIQSENHDVKWG